MVILIAGASHTGKTWVAQKLLEQHHYPYMSIDHLKMGMIRSGLTDLTVYDDEAMTDFLWPIVREIIKTAIENRQHLIVEGCYIPFDWRKDFPKSYQDQIEYRCLIMPRAYIQTHFEEIRGFASVVEQRLDDSGLNMESLIMENEQNLLRCQEHGCRYILIDEDHWKGAVSL